MTVPPCVCGMSSQQGGFVSLIIFTECGKAVPVDIHVGIRDGSSVKLNACYRLFRLNAHHFSVERSLCFPYFLDNNQNSGIGICNETV